MKKYRVIKCHKNEFEIPIKVSKGDKVICIEDSNEDGDWPGWVLCKTIDNEGWIPKQIIERTDNRGIISEDYDATEFDLSIDEILIEEKKLNGWIWGSKKGTLQNKGWAPLNCLKVL